MILYNRILVFLLLSIGCAQDPCGHGVELSDETLLPSQLLMRGALAVFTAFLPQKVAVEKLDVGQEERRTEKS